MNIYKDAYLLLRYIERHGTVTYGELKNHFPQKDVFQLIKTLSTEHAIFWEHFTGFDSRRKKHSNFIAEESRICCTDAGKKYVEDQRAQSRDRWFTRLIAIWGGLTGTAAIVVEIVLHFL